VTTDFSALFRALASTDFILIGGLAAAVHGAARATDTVIVSVFGVECRCLTLERLIQVKRAAGRVKDFEAIAELEAIAEERHR
jgi:hypothetical protein